MAKNQAVWALDVGQAALKALKLVPSRLLRPGRRRKRSTSSNIPRSSVSPTPIPKHSSPRLSATFHRPKRPQGVQGSRSRFPVRRDWSSLSSFPRSRRSASPISSSLKPSSRSPSPSKKWSGPYQQIGDKDEKDAEEEEFTTVEVGLFAMKRDQINRAITAVQRRRGSRWTSCKWVRSLSTTTSPSTNSKGSESERVDRPPRHRSRQHRPDHQRWNSRIWQRNVPIGGNHFTRALDQRAQTNLRQGRTPEAKRHQGPRSQSRLHRDAGDLQRLRQRSESLDRILFERQSPVPRSSRLLVSATVSSLPGLQKFLQQNLNGLDSREARRIRQANWR